MFIYNFRKNANEINKKLTELKSSIDFFACNPSFYSFYDEYVVSLIDRLNEEAKKIKFTKGEKFAQKSYSRYAAIRKEIIKKMNKRNKENDEMTIKESISSYKRVRESLLHEITKDNNIKFDIEVEPSKVLYNQYESSYCALISCVDILNGVLGDNFNGDSISLKYLVYCDKLKKVRKMMSKISMLNETEEIVKYVNEGFYDNDTIDNFLRLIQKYGIVPEKAYPTNDTFKNSKTVNLVLKKLMIQYGVEYAALESPVDCDKLRKKYIKKLMQVLLDEYGVPPTKVDASLLKDTEEDLSPKEIYDKYIDESYISVCNYGIDAKFVQFLGSNYISYNTNHEEIQDMILSSLKSGKPCTVVFNLPYTPTANVKSFIDYDSVINSEYKIKVSNEVDESLPKGLHAMLITGVKLENDKPILWKIKNSYGVDYNDNGYLVCDNGYFEKNFVSTSINTSIFFEKYPQYNPDNDEKVLIKE